MSDKFDDGALDEMGLRSRAAGYRDGLLELFAAGVLGSLAVSWLVGPGSAGILAAMWVLYGWKLVDRIRERIIYPRIGYYKERADDSKDSTRGMLAFIAGSFALMALVVIVTGGATDAAEWRRAAPLVSGVTIAAGFRYAAVRSKMARHNAIAAWSAVSGGLAWWVGTGESYSYVGWHLLGVAIPLAIVGAWTLTNFLQHHPVADGE